MAGAAMARAANTAASGSNLRTLVSFAQKIEQERCSRQGFAAPSAQIHPGLTGVAPA
jgi:hypothetical protein